MPKGRRSSWVLLIADGSENFADLSASHAQLLSKGGHETLFFSCSDTVMATELLCFRDGKEVWAVEYDGGDTSKQPVMRGDAPRTAHEILSALRTKQQAADDADYIYDLTAQLGLPIVGFRHDTVLEGDDPEPFQLLREPNIQAMAWWQFWKR